MSKQNEPSGRRGIQMAPLWIPMDAPMAYAVATKTTDAAQRGLRLIRRLVRLNLGLVALQALSAGFLMSGYGLAVNLHANVAHVLQLGALTQAIVAIVLWRRGRVPASIAGASVGLFAIVLLQVGLGYTKRYWLHVPIGVGMFGGLIRQLGRLATPSPADAHRADNA